MITLLLHERIAERHMTQSELSRITGIRAATICEMCRNLTERINLHHLESICRALDCDICDIMTLQYDELKAAEAQTRRTPKKATITTTKSECPDPPRPEHPQRDSTPKKGRTKRSIAEYALEIKTNRTHPIEEKEIIAFLQSIGIGKNMAGFNYFCTAFEIIAEDEKILVQRNIGLTIYEKIAARYDKKPSVVGARMYDAIVEAWTYGSYLTQEKIFGFPDHPERIHPNIGEFLIKGYFYIKEGRPLVLEKEDQQ